MKTTRARLGVRIVVAMTAVGISVGLTGCLQASTLPPGITPTASPSPSAPSSAATPSANPTQSAHPTPPKTAPRFTENCNILFTPAQVYAYNPNFVADASYKPKAGSIPAAIAAYSGQTCGWLNETSGSLIEVAIATPLAPDLAKAKAAASGGTAISVGGENGYFAVTNGVGSAQFFFGSFWLDVSSQDFAAVSDAQSTYTAVVQNQQHAGG
jgi:hypothetical protein